MPVHNRPLITDHSKQTTLTKDPFITDNFHNGSVMNVVCYERVCYERVLLWTCSIMNVVCYEWSVMNRSLLNGHLICQARTNEIPEARGQH